MISPIELMFAGNFVDAKKSFDLAPLTNSFDLANYAICLIHLGDFRNALSVYERLRLERADIDDYYVYSGICHWCLGEPLQAVSLWRQAQKCEYTDAAGGAIPVALSYYAAVREQESLKEASTVLKKFWKPRLSKTWPGQVIGYLLGKISQGEFLGLDPFFDATMKIRTDCQALFWCGVGAVRDGLSGPAEDFFVRSCSTGPQAILEPEYYLARYEAQQAARVP